MPFRAGQVAYTRLICTGNGHFWFYLGVWWVGVGESSVTHTTCVQTENQNDDPTHVQRVDMSLWIYQERCYQLMQLSVNLMCTPPESQQHIVPACMVTKLIGLANLVSGGGTKWLFEKYYMLHHTLHSQYSLSFTDFQHFALKNLQLLMRLNPVIIYY